MYRILIVDSQERHLQNIKTMLETAPENMKFSFAGSPEEALQILGSESIDVFVCELEIPVMSGEELFAMCGMMSPDTIRIALSAARDIRKTLEIINRIGVYRLILKPCNFVEDLLNPIEMAISVKQALAKKEAERIEKQQKLKESERKYAAIQKEIEVQTREYEIVLRTVLGLVKNNLKLKNPPFSDTGERTIYTFLEELYKAFVKYYVLEPREWEFNEKLLLKEFRDTGAGRECLLRNNIKETMPQEVVPKVCYSLYLMGKLVAEQFLRYRMKAEITQEDGKTVIFCVCDLSASRAEDGEFLYRIREREIFRNMYQSAMHILKIIADKVVVGIPNNPYAVKVSF